MNSTQTYKPKAPLSASPATGSTSTITAPEGTLGWAVSVSVQDAYLVFGDTTTPSATVGLTVPAGTVLPLLPYSGNIYCRAVTSGAIVNAIPLVG